MRVSSLLAKNAIRKNGRIYSNNSKVGMVVTYHKSNLVSAYQYVRMFSNINNNNKRIEASLIAGLIGDSLALAGHYEYDAAKIKQHVGEYNDFMSPGERMGGKTHGPGKVAGDLTDAGDIAVMLLDYITLSQSYDFDGFASYWYQQILQGYGSCNFQTVNKNSECPPNTKPGYLNGGTRRTLAMLESNPNAKGEVRKSLAADVNCLVAATHFLPLFFITSDQEELVKQSKSTVYISHRNRDPVFAAEFLSRTLYNILYENMELESALDIAARATNDAFINQKLTDAKRKVAEVSSGNRPLSKEEFADDIALTSMARLWDVGKSEKIKVGKASPTEGALPGALYFSLRYKHSLEKALIANANCGGDSAARGIVIGMLLGAIHGTAAIPLRWLEGLRSLNHVKKQISVIHSNIKTKL